MIVIGDALGGQAPQPDGALLADLGVRREVLHRQNIQSGKELRAVLVVGHEQGEERVDGFGERFGLLVAIYYNDQRTAGGLPEQHGVQRLGGGGEAGKGRVLARADAAQHVLEARMPAQVQEEIANNWMDQGWRILSTIFVVE